MRILYLEPFWGGSHRSVAESLAEHLRSRGHFVQFCHLPARFWKWRMRAASFDFLKQLEALAASDPEPCADQNLRVYLNGFDLVFASALFDIAQFKGLLPVCPPLLAYFHENQLTYPEPQQKNSNRHQKDLNCIEAHPIKRKIDFHFGLTNISSALAADTIAFNSEFQRQQFLESIRPFLQALPDKKPTWVVERLRQKSSILHLGIREEFLTAGSLRLKQTAHPPVILWNHRWEFDKQPEVFFSALRAAKQSFQAKHEAKREAKRGNLEGATAFRLVVLGENFQVQPKVFDQAKEEFAQEILHWGFAEGDSYLHWLSRSDLVVSCAIQENFGIAVLEAVAAGAWPLLPKRLSYPEIFSGLPEHIAAEIFYHSFEELVSALSKHLAGTKKPDLLQYVACFAWPRRIPDFEEALAKTARFR